MISNFAPGAITCGTRRLLPALCLLVLATAALAAQAAGDRFSRMDLLDDEKVLRPGDRLLYSVEEEREQVVALLVNGEGEVNIPLLGYRNASGKTCKRLAYELKAELEIDFFHRATVIIQLYNSESSLGEVTVLGEVRAPGPIDIPVDQVYYVSNAVLDAGGFTVGANASQVILVRKNPNNPENDDKYAIDVGAILQSGQFDKDMALKPGDLVVVPRSQNLGGEFYIDGEVVSPGVYQLPPNREITVSRAVLMAGGFEKFARKDAVKLIGVDGETLIVDVEAILEQGKRELDKLVRPGDTIRVEDQFWAM